MKIIFFIALLFISAVYIININALPVFAAAAVSASSSSHYNQVEMLSNNARKTRYPDFSGETPIFSDHEIFRAKRTTTNAADKNAALKHVKPTYDNAQNATF